MKFLLEKDITESTLLNYDNSFRLDISVIGRFINESNEWYLQKCLELGVSESSIIVFDEINDDIDKRDVYLKLLVCYHCLKSIFFSLWKTENDIFYLKYIEIEKLFNNNLVYLTQERVTNNKPAVIEKNNNWYTPSRWRG